MQRISKDISLYSLFLKKLYLVNMSPPVTSEICDRFSLNIINTFTYILTYKTKVAVHRSTNVVRTLVPLSASWQEILE